MSISKISVGLDGTLASSQEAVVEDLNNEFREELRSNGQIFSYLGIKDKYDWGKIYREYGITSDECYDRIYEKWRTDSSQIDSIDLSFDMERGFENLYERFNVDIVTRNPYTEEIKNWLEDAYIFEGEHYDNIVSIYGEEKRKGQMDYDFFIDDDPNIIKDLGTHQGLFLRSRSYNRKVDHRIGPVMYRMNSLLETSEILVSWDKKLEKVEGDR